MVQKELLLLQVRSEIALSSMTPTGYIDLRTQPADDKAALWKHENIALAVAAWPMLHKLHDRHSST